MECLYASCFMILLSVEAVVASDVDGRFGLAGSASCGACGLGAYSSTSGDDDAGSLSVHVHRLVNVCVRVRFVMA